MSDADGQRKGLELAGDIAWQDLSAMDPVSAAARCGAAYDPERGCLTLPFLGLRVEVHPRTRTLESQPDPLTPMEEVMVLRYLCLGGAEATEDWISFRELPGGRNYLGPFLGRTARPLAARFGHDQPAFEAASRRLGGDPLEYGDASFLFRLLPRFWMAVVLHLGDEEFLPEVSILFDRAAAQRVTTEDCAAAGQVLARRLLRAAG